MNLFTKHANYIEEEVSETLCFKEYSISFHCLVVEHHHSMGIESDHKTFAYFLTETHINYFSVLSLTNQPLSELTDSTLEVWLVHTFAYLTHLS